MNDDARIAWVDRECRLLAATREEFARTRPFEGLTIGSAIHLEPKTAALAVTLQTGGARVVATGNLNSTQVPTMGYLRERGIEIVGGVTRDTAERDGYLDEILAERPDLLLDNGGEMFLRYLNAPYAGLRGGTEETTSGRMLLAPQRERLAMPILVINDSPIKQFAENQHAVGQSCLESYMRCTNRITNGERVVVIGYGWCGRGVAENFRFAGAQVTVWDADPVMRLRAMLDGFDATPLPDALRTADCVITVTGGGVTIGVAEAALLPDGCVLGNAGHFPVEIAVAELEALPGAEARDNVNGIRSIRFADGREVHVLAAGHMFNLGGPAPLGNSIQSMDIGFTLQARCLEAVATGAVSVDDCVVPVPRSIDVAVSNAYLALKGY